MQQGGHHVKSGREHKWCMKLHVENLMVMNV